MHQEHNCQFKDCADDAPNRLYLDGYAEAVWETWLCPNHFQRVKRDIESGTLTRA